MSLAYQIVNDLWRLPRHFASSGYDKAIEYLKSILPFREIKFNEMDQCNGWVIPPKWDILEAKIINDGQVVLDATGHPLAVVSHSKSFEGEVDLETLKEHMFYDKRFNDAIPYHFRYSYRPWDRDWGFCVSKDFYDSLQDGVYEVVIKTNEQKPELRIIDYKVQGDSNYEIVFVAHLDHPGMANDDLAGCAVGVDLMNHIQKKKNKFSYRLVLLQEIIGSQIYLNSIDTENVIGGIFLEMLGVDVPLSVQRSYNGNTSMDYLLIKCIEQMNIKAQFTAFRELVGNDEIVFEAYGVPMPSLVRFPYPEYHCDKDDIDIIRKHRLSEARDVLLNVVECIEQDFFVKKKFSGVICLSNPDYNLYVEPGQPAFNNVGELEIRNLMEYMCILPKGEFISSLSRMFHMDNSDVYNYLKKWAELDLIEMI